MRPPLLGPAPDARQRGDWLVAEDDTLVERFRRCVLCGALGDRHAVYALVQTHDVILAAVRCALCLRTDPDMARLLGLLDRRYDPGRQWATEIGMLVRTTP